MDIVERLRSNDTVSTTNCGVVTLRERDALHIEAAEEIERLRKLAGGERGGEGLRQFTRTMIHCAWEGGSADGGFIQETAEQCGLIKCVPFDPERHAIGDPLLWPNAGDDWFVFDGPLAGAERSGEEISRSSGCVFADLQTSPPTVGASSRAGNSHMRKQKAPERTPRL